MKRSILTALALLATTAFATLPAQAVILGGIDWDTSNTQILELTPVVPGGNQPLNVQCIICGDNQPQQALDFGYTNFKNSGNLSDILYFSTNVSGAAIPVLTLGHPLRRHVPAGVLASHWCPRRSQFDVGIDVNDTNIAQTLESFYTAERDSADCSGSVLARAGRHLLTDRKQRHGLPRLYSGHVHSRGRHSAVRPRRSDRLLRAHLWCERWT